MRTRQPTIANPAGSTSPADGRWAKRRSSRILATITGTVSPMNCMVRDTSSTGAMIELVMGPNAKADSAERLPKTFTLVMPADRSQVECEVAWAKGNSLGVRFTAPARHFAKPASRFEIKKPEPQKGLVARLLGATGFSKAASATSR